METISFLNPTAAGRGSAFVRVAVMAGACLLAGAGVVAPVAAETSSATRLPAPSVSDNATPAMFLQAAAQALAAGRIGEAQEAMERAESRVLTRSVRPSQARLPDPQSLVRQIAAARAALSEGDRGRSLTFLIEALRNPDAQGN